MEELEAGTKLLGQMHIKVKNIALTCYSFRILDRAAVAVVLSVLKNLRIVTNDDHSHVVDKYKIRRGKKAKCKEFQNQNIEGLIPLQGLYFVGRKHNPHCI